MADTYGLTLLPEIHTEYGEGVHKKLAANGYPVYDFFFPGLVIDALDRGTNRHLLRWINELLESGITAINMLGCHDGIPLLDLKGSEVDGVSKVGLLSDEEIDAAIDRIIARGGRVKNLYGSDGKKIAYYQINATFFSALGENEQKLCLARAIQMFMPGIPQVWYLDLFAGKNDYAAADRGGTGGHKEINRTTLSIDVIERGVKQPVVRDQLVMMRLRNTSPAFNGKLTVGRTNEQSLTLTWKNQGCEATLEANLRDLSFTITHKQNGRVENVISQCSISESEQDQFFEQARYENISDRFG
jgi:sucrose phosphorylase